MARKAGTLAVAITANSTQFDRTIARVQGEIAGLVASLKGAIKSNTSSFDRALTKTGGGIKGFSTAFGIVGGVMIGAGKRMVDTFDNIAKRSTALGITTDRYQMLAYAAKLTGTAMGTVESAMMKANKVLAQAASGDAKSIEAFKRIGLSVQNLKGLAPDRLFDEIAAALRQIPDPTERSAAQFDIFGKSAMELNGFLADYIKLGGEARDQGLLVSQETLKAAENINDQMGKLSATLLKIADTLGIIKKISDLVEAASSRAAWAETINGAADWGWSIADKLGLNTGVWQNTRPSDITTKGIKDFIASRWDTFANVAFNPSLSLSERAQYMKNGIAQERRIIEGNLRASVGDRAAPTEAEMDAARAARDKRVAIDLARIDNQIEQAEKRLANAEKGAAAAAGKAAKKLTDSTVTGSFSLSDLRMMVSRNSPAERTADATEQMQREVADIKSQLAALRAQRERIAGQAGDAEDGAFAGAPGDEEDIAVAAETNSEAAEEFRKGVERFGDFAGKLAEGFGVDQIVEGIQKAFTY